MFKRCLNPGRSNSALIPVGLAARQVFAKLLRAPRHPLQPLPFFPSSTVRRGRRSVLVSCAPAVSTTVTPFLVQPCRSISFSYTTAVPCARFNVSTKDLARITNQPALPPDANIYVIDVRAKHNKKKKPNTRRIMSKVIEAHREEKAKATEAMDAADAYTPPLVFLVKTDDTTKQAARRQQMMGEQLNALGAFGEFRVCVLNGPKSRHWSQYVPTEEKSTAAEAADSTPATPPSATHSTDAVGAAAMAVVAGTAAAGATPHLAPSDQYEDTALATDAHPVSTVDNATVIDGEGDAVAHDGATAAEEEEEWEEVVEEVEEVEVEEGEEIETEDGTPQHHAQPAHHGAEDAGTATPSVSVREREEEEGVVEAASPASPTAAAATPPPLSSSSSPLESASSIHAVDDGSQATADLGNSDTHSSVPPKNGAAGTAAANPVEGVDADDLPDDSVEAEAEAEEDDAAEFAEEEETEEPEEHAESPPSTAHHAPASSKKEAAASSTREVNVEGVSSAVPAAAATQHAQTTSKSETVKEEEEGLEEFDIDGPMATEPTITTDVTPSHANERTVASIAAAAAATATPPSSEATPTAVEEAAPETKGKTTPSPTPPPETPPAGESEKETNAGEPNSEEVKAPGTADSSIDSAPPVETATPPATVTAAPPPPPPPLSLPKPTTPMPAYPDVSARLYHGASTVYLSDRALRELPLTANVLVIDRLDWRDDTVAEMEAALEEVDPVVGHVVLYRDAYAPQAESIVKENIVFREALIPFIFVFRTTLSRQVALAQQRRFVAALRSRPPGLSAEQQALLAGQNDRTFVCVLCAEESEKGGENPLAAPQQRPPRRLSAEAQVQHEASEFAAPEQDADEAELHDTSAPDEEDGVAVEAEAAELEPESVDALQRLWTMMNVTSSPSTLSFPDNADVHAKDQRHRDSNEENTMGEEQTKDDHPTSSRAAEKKHFNVPVPTYEVEDDDSTKPFSSSLSSSSRRGRNVRGSAAANASGASSSALPPPPTSLPQKPPPPPLSLGLLGFEKIVFGKPDAYSYHDTAYAQHGTAATHTGGREAASSSSTSLGHNTEVDEYEERNGERRAGVHNATDDSTDGALTSSALSSADAAENHFTAQDTEKSTAKSKQSKRFSSASSSSPRAKRRRSRTTRKGKSATQREDAAAAAAGAEAQAEAASQTEDAALEDFILSLYEDNDDRETKKRKSKKAPRKGRGAAASVSSARSAIKSASRRKGS